MKILSNSDLKTKQLPQWIVDKLRMAPHRGEGCHHWLFGMACNLLPWRNADDTFQLIRDAVQDPRVPDSEILKQVQSASMQPTLWKPNVLGSSQPQKNFHQIANSSKQTLDVNQWLADHCPFAISEDDIKNVSPAQKLIEFCGVPTSKAAIWTAFRTKEIICVQEFGNDAPPQKAYLINDWDRLINSSAQYICVNPVKSVQGVLKKRLDGTEYYSVRCLENILEQRYAPVEFDKTPIETQLRIHAWLSTKLPLLLLVHSGKRSIHGWYLVLGLSREQVKDLYRFLANLGVDKGCNDASRLTRLPGAIRRDRNEETGEILIGSEQRLLYLDPHVSGAFKTFHPGLKELALERGAR